METRAARTRQGGLLNHIANQFGVPRNQNNQENNGEVQVEQEQPEQEEE